MLWLVYLTIATAILAMLWWSVWGFRELFGSETSHATIRELGEEVTPHELVDSPTENGVEFARWGAMCFLLLLLFFRLFNE